ncbi:Ficolin-1 [Holothuria leucospilota]|uniref:Ficolin-1 n=1 Tax=Holothuria leucospilota TaxID=206669 RepID=A0A9Q1BW96_HOLLE|nr:Ficolin-1 [Holothuria leucospilota]
MASRTHLHIFLVLFGVCSIFLDDISAAENNQFGNDRDIEGQGSSFFFYQKSEYPRDCSEVRDSCSSVISSGVYFIKPDGYEEAFEVYCDNTSDAGGWTVILRRFDGSISFARIWEEYTKGFGFLSTEFWLGNDKLSYLTNQAVYELFIDIQFQNGTSCDLHYDPFRISDEWSGYAISTVGTYESVAACSWKEGSECDNAGECNSMEVSTNYTDCNDVSNDGARQDGVYYIRPEGWDDPPFKVFCNMSIDGGSWTVIQRRVDGSTNFYRNWTEYRNGFGDIQNEFWLGNEKLHYITKQATYEYRFDFVFSSHSYHNKYTNFHVGDETNKYRLANGGTRSGTRGYSLYNIRNTPFSTHDEDNDGRSYDCAEGHQSGWWHGAYFYTGFNYCYYFQSGGTRVTCSDSNPNGDYNGGVGQNIYDDYNSYGCNLKYTEMKIRRTS